MFIILFFFGTFYTIICCSTSVQTEFKFTDETYLLFSIFVPFIYLFAIFFFVIGYKFGSRLHPFGSKSYLYNFKYDTKEQLEDVIISLGIIKEQVITNARECETEINILKKADFTLEDKVEAISKTKKIK
jgi:hypothetical protein